MGLRAKLYSIKVDMKLKDDDGNDYWINQKSANAGTKAYVAARELKHELYKDVLFGGEDVEIYQNTIRSYNHVLYNIRQPRVALSCIDSKRYILPNLIDTRAYGHYLNQYEVEPDEVFDW